MSNLQLIRRGGAVILLGLFAFAAGDRPALALKEPVIISGSAWEITGTLSVRVAGVGAKFPGSEATLVFGPNEPLSLGPDEFLLQVGIRDGDEVSVLQVGGTWIQTKSGMPPVLFVEEDGLETEIERFLDLPPDISASVFSGWTDRPAAKLWVKAKKTKAGAQIFLRKLEIGISLSNGDSSRRGRIMFTGRGVLSSDTPEPPALDTAP